MTKLSLLEDLQIREEVAANPEGVHPNTVVRVMESIKQLNESTEALDGDAFIALLEGLANE